MTENDSPQPCIYFCLDRDKADRVMAPALRADAHEATCHDCGSAIVFLGERLIDVLLLCVMHHRELLLLCQRCGQRRADEAIDPQFLEVPLSDEAATIQRQWQLERN